MRIPPLFLPLLPLFSTQAYSAVVNIDFNHAVAPVVYAGPAAAPDPAGEEAIWNSVVRPGWSDDIQSGPLVDSDGEVTSVTLSLGINGSHVSAGDQELGGVSGEYLGLMSDYFYLSSGSAEVVVSKSGTISGLIPSNTYDLYFYSQGDKFSSGFQPGQNGLFTIGEESQQTGWDGTPGGDGQWTAGTEFVRFSVQADSEGTIGFTWSNVVAGPAGNVEEDKDGTASMYAAFNALQIVDTGTEAVPEPSTALLGVAGLLGALLRRRRD